MKKLHAVPAALLLLLLAACGSAPRAPQPALIEAALQSEQDGARHYARGEFVAAAPRFGEAARLFTSIDDMAGTIRNALHQVRAELAAGQAAVALSRLGQVQTDDPVQTIEIAQLRTQAHLALGQTDAATIALTTAFEKCALACPQQASLHLLDARLKLAEKRPQEALTHAITALQILQAQDQPAETANAWRITAAARLATGDGAGALTAAETALEIDRHLARPEKIIRDWLLIGDIRHNSKVGTDPAARDAAVAAATAYRRALDIALAAGLDTLVAQARRALAAVAAVTP